MAGVTRKQAKGRVLAAWADDDWWRGEPIATGVTTEVGDAWLIEVVPRRTPTRRGRDAVRLSDRARLMNGQPRSVASGSPTTSRTGSELNAVTWQA